MKPVVTMLIAATLGAEFLLPSFASACAVCGVDGEPGFLWSMGFSDQHAVSDRLDYGRLFRVQFPARKESRRRTKAFLLNKKEMAQ